MPSKPEKANADRKKRYYASLQRENARARKYHAEQRHGGPAEWARMHAAQGGLCYLCREPLPGRGGRGGLAPAVDHDHSCCGKGKLSCRICRRGIAHAACNAAVGLAGDDPGRLRRLADNLERAKADVADRRQSAALQLDLLSS